MIVGGKRFQNSPADVLTSRLRDEVQLFDHNDGGAQFAGEAVCQQQIAQGTAVFHDHAAFDILIAGQACPEGGNEDIPADRVRHRWGIVHIVAHFQE